MSTRPLPARRAGGRGVAGEPRLHRRQFVLGPEPWLAADGWVSEQITPSLHLSRCAELPVASVTDGHGVPCCLPRAPLQSDADAPAPLEQLAEHAEGPLVALCASWSGRWRLFSDTELHIDASGLLG